MHGNSFAQGNSMANGQALGNGQPVRPGGSASIWDHLEPPLPQ